MEVLVLAAFCEEHMQRIREAAGEDAVVTQVLETGPFFKRKRTAEALKTAEVVIGEPLVKLIPDGAPLKWVQSTWAGTDFYTHGRYPFPEGVILTSVAGEAYGHTVSQYVVGQILSLTQNLSLYVRQQPSESWNDLGRVMSLEGTTAIIYGAGDIGSCVAKRLSGFDLASVIGVCRDTSRPREHFDRLVTLNEAEFLLPACDVVVCCLPRTEKTSHYFNERRLKCIKEGGVLVNVGRGDFVDLDALYRILSDGHLRGAALDVTDPEPLPMQHPLWRQARCNITPHIAGGAFGHSFGTEERICRICCDNLRRYIAGEPLTHQVI